MVAPAEACRNLQALAGMGMAGRYGLYEALDFTSTRLPLGRSSAVIQSFMAHHQGMSFLALTAVLLERPMHRRFEADPQFRPLPCCSRSACPRVRLNTCMRPRWRKKKRQLAPMKASCASIPTLIAPTLPSSCSPTAIIT